MLCSIVIYIDYLSKLMDYGASASRYMVFMLNQGSIDRVLYLQVKRVTVDSFY